MNDLLNANEHEGLHDENRAQQGHKHRLLLQAFHVNGLTTAAIFNIQYIEYTDYPSSAVYIVILWDDVYHARPRTLWTVDQANDPALFPVLNPNPDYLERQRKMSYTTDDNPPLNIVYS